MIVKADTLPTIYCACRDCPYNSGRNDCTRPEEIEIDTGGRCLVGINAVAKHVGIVPAWEISAIAEPV